MHLHTSCMHSTSLMRHLCTITSTIIMLVLLQLYERSAAERWIRRHARVPHSPETPAFKQSLRHCSDMDRLLRQFRAEFGLGIEWEAS